MGNTTISKLEGAMQKPSTETAAPSLLPGAASSAEPWSEPCRQQELHRTEELRLCACQRKSLKNKKPVGSLPITSRTALDSHKD